MNLVKSFVLLIFIILAFLATGCSTTVPVKRTFPEVPAEILQTCPDLSKTAPTTKLSDVLVVVTENYSKYHECRIKVDAWIEWYKSQKEVFDSVNN
jgi:hypothetical protein